MVRRPRKRCRWEASLERTMAKSVVCDTSNGLGFPGNEVHHLNETVDAGCVAKVPGVVGLIISAVWGGEYMAQ